jgi:hypothetical protein
LAQETRLTKNCRQKLTIIPMERIKSIFAAAGTERRQMATVFDSTTRRAPLILHRNLSLLIGMNFLIGLLFAHYFFTTSFLKGQVSGFLWPEGDMTEYLTGAKFFIYDDWRFPVFISNFLERSYPQSMAFTDTVPLFALFAKIIYKLAGYEIAHLAYWYFTAILLQPVAFSLLLWSMGVRDLVLNAAGGILSLLVPAFLFRVGHPQFGHFTFITAMALYFITAREARFPQAVIGRAVLSLLNPVMLL